MKRATLPTQSALHQLLDYDEGTGVFTWKARLDIAPRAGGWNTRYAGTVAGSHDKDGYLGIRIHGKPYKAHQLAWVYVYGLAPLKDIDHIDGVRDSNPVKNLRQATTSQNMQNMRARPKVLGLPKGVQLRCDGKKYCAYIRADGKSRNLGSFDSVADAQAAYAMAARTHFGEFARPS